MPWTADYYPIAVPEAFIPAANKVAALFDTDSGGDKTFTVANAGFNGAKTHCLVRTKLHEGYQHFLGPDRDVVAWHQLLIAKDSERAPTLEEVQELAGVFLFDTQCDGLIEIIEQESS